ncbi:hypothetical protein HRH25_19695 [Flavisolibacter sp. BT320]|nr:hypothetical protein [Flavisolibacter longurius]
MKKTLLAMLLAGGSMSLFAQTNPTTNTPTQEPTTSQPTTSQPTTTQPSTDPSMQTNTMQNNTMTNTNSNINTWNGVSVNSTSWAPERDPSWNWNNYGVWSGSANWNANPNSPTGNTAANMNNNNMNADGTMSSTGNYSAYGGTAVPYLPANVQFRFNQDFPTTANTPFSWNQYGEWFHTYHMNNGRLTQYFYDSRGNGYALALPVLHTYVPENIVANALNKYGSSLYSISMVKTNGNDSTGTYQIGLLDRGQLYMQYLDENGVTVGDVWRVEEVDSTGVMTSTETNAAMGSDMNTNQSATNQSTMGNTSDMNQTQTATDPSSQVTEIKTKEGKTEIEYADGSQTKIKTEKDKIKIKTKDGKKTKIENE